MHHQINQYNLMEELSKKYSHTTYLASPTNQLKHQVVLTLFTASLFSFPHEREAFLLKAQHTKALEHPHVVPILDMGIEEEQPYTVRAYLPNGSLRSRLNQLSPQRLALWEALTVVLEVGQALMYAHERNILHGNLKPENIFFDEKGQVRLTDFYLVGRNDAIIQDQAAEEFAFCYLAPEQLAGTCDARSDQYALGCLAYELITGRLPFAMQSSASRTGYMSNPFPVPLSESVADLPPSLETVVLKTLSKDPADRFFDFSLFLEVIRSVLSPPPAFPLARSIRYGKQRTSSHVARSAEALLSPIRQRAAKRTTKHEPSPPFASQPTAASGTSSSVGRKMADASVVSPLSNVSMSGWTEMKPLSASQTPALQSHQFTSPLVQDAHPLGKSEQSSSQQSLRKQKNAISSTTELEAEPQLEDLTSELPITRRVPEHKTQNVLFSQSFMEEETTVSAVNALDWQDKPAIGKTALALTGRTASPRSWVGLTRPSGSRILGLVCILLVVIAAVPSAFWLAGMFTSDASSGPTDVTSNNTVAISSAVPSADLTAVPSADLTAIPATHLVAHMRVTPTASVGVTPTANVGMTPTANVGVTPTVNSVPTILIANPTMVPTAVPPAVPQTIVIDDSVQGTGTNQFDYSGNGWGHCTNCNCTNCGKELYNSSNSWDSTANNYVTIFFTGTQINFYGVIDTKHGIGAVSIDGGSETMIDFYATARAGNQLLWSSPVMAAGTHTFKLRVTGNKNVHSSNVAVTVDRVDILS